MSENLFRPRQKLATVPGNSQGIGTYRADPMWRNGRKTLAKTPKTPECPFLGFFRQGSVALKSCSEPDHLPHPIDNADTTLFSFNRNQHVKAVRAKINGCNIIPIAGLDFTVHGTITSHIGHAPNSSGHPLSQWRKMFDEQLQFSRVPVFINLKPIDCFDLPEWRDLFVFIDCVEYDCINW